VLRKLAVAAAVLAPAGAVAGHTAQPAQAATCATIAQVYLTSVSPWSIRYEVDAVPDDTDNYTLIAGVPSFRVGGNGLRPGSVPSWNVQSNFGGSFQFSGGPAGGNCVANERFVSPGRAGQPGEVWRVSANYDAGNSGQGIRDQAHFQITFVDPPPPPEPVYPDPNPNPCSYDLLCF
jgi:hypothetical protein